MSKKSRWTLSLLGTLLLVFGLVCLNYTRAANWEHHQEFARLHNLPRRAQAFFMAASPLSFWVPGLLDL
jgi:hypothetical protein